MTEEEIINLKNQMILGKYSNLRIASEKDAQFILDLRLNPALNKYIGKTDPSLVKQKEWITNARFRNDDFHFIIENKKNEPCGTIAVYGINYADSIAEWGRWITKPNAPIAVTLESAILVQYFAFKKLHLKSLHGGTNKSNWQVVNFHKSYAQDVSTDDQSIYFYFEEQNLKILASKYKNYHNLFVENILELPVK
jgi:RimJ/RimL family protein N-acetyltransferase